MPNLLIIHTDQQSWWTLGCYGGSVVETPNIDRLATEGAMLTNFFTNSAVCTPSRGCFLTGRYPHSHGAYTNNIPLNRDEVTFAQVLRDQGYQTRYAGKWHLDGIPRPGWVHPERTMGFTHAEHMFNRGHWKKITDGQMEEMEPTVYPYHVIGDASSYTTDWLAGKTIDFIRRYGADPFCFMVSLPDPHGPVDVRPPYDTMFSPADMPMPKTLNDPDLPDWALELQDKSPFGRGKPGRESRLAEFLALYYGEVALIDDGVGRIICELEAQGILDDTVVVFTTDHGEYAGEHGLQAKNQLYETAYRIPFLIRWPERIPPGTRIDRVMSTVDFQPTILSLMGVPLSGREQGRDGSALLEGKAAEWEDVAFLHHSSDTRAGIFTKEIELAYVKDRDSIMFDRMNDPNQVINLFHDGGVGETRRDLTEMIVNHHRDLDSPAYAWLEEL